MISSSSSSSSSSASAAEAEMSSTEMPRLWAAAQKAYDDKDLESSAAIFGSLGNHSARVLYNSAVVLLLLGRPDKVLQKLTEAIQKDKCLAVAFFRRACVFYSQMRYAEAAADFEKCEELFPNKNNVIDYTQLGLAAKLFRSSVNYNAGLCYLKAGNLTKGMGHLLAAQNAPLKWNGSTIERTLKTLETRKTEDFEASLMVLSDAAPLFSPPRIPPEKKTNFIGTPKVIASADQSRDRATAGSSGRQGRQRGEEREGTNVSNVSLSQVPPTSLNPVIPSRPSNPPPRRYDDQVHGSEEEHFQSPPPSFPPPRTGPS